MPQRWAIIIDAVTTLLCCWPSSRITSHIYCHMTCCSRARFSPAIAGDQLLALMSGLGGVLEWGPK